MARRPSPARWICPLCERSVPPDVPACYCGTSRAVVEAHAQRERERKTRPFPWPAFLGELGVVAVVVYWFVAPSEMAKAPSPSTPVATPASPSAQPVAASSPNPLEPAGTRPTETPSPRTSERAVLARPAPTPAPSPSPGPGPEALAKTDRAELDGEREEGEKRLEQILARLQAEMTRLGENARQFEAVCLNRQGNLASCKRLYDEITSSGDTLARDLEGAEDDARHAWVSPGLVRDLRQRHGLEEDSWRDLSEKVHHLARQYQGSQ